MRILVLEPHPVQYRAPLWRKVNELLPGGIHVAYASDLSMRGYVDEEFNCTIRWDMPLLEGYPYTILCPEQSGGGNSCARALARLIRQLEPQAILFNAISSLRDAQAFVLSLSMRVPVWLRTETQDEAYTRSRFKSFYRRGFYRALYKMIDRFFYIGHLNHMHFIAHGVPAERLFPARYGTIDPTAGMTIGERSRLRDDARLAAGIPSNTLVVGFSGKFIPKKDPGSLFAMLPFLDPRIRQRLCLYFVGCGELERTLKAVADRVKADFGVSSHFAGFVNQSQLARHYCAMDVFVLPSRRMGETWGLVVNEALQCGCSAIVSTAVGCGVEFKHLKRFRIFEEGSASGLAKMVESLAGEERSFTWASSELAAYSLDNAALSIAQAMGAPSVSVPSNSFHPV
jgi:glycosyltransferase involved in cell wall biosynthesis